MNIPEVKDFFDKGEVKALSNDRIKVGCAEFDRSDVFRHASSLKPGSVYHYDESPYWLTRDDCTRMLKLMDEFQDYKPFFKPGQKIKAGFGRSEPYTLKSFVEVGLANSGKSEWWQTDKGGRYYFYTDGSEVILPPETEPEPKFKVGDWVRCSGTGHMGQNPFRIEGAWTPSCADSPGPLYYPDAEKLGVHERHDWRGCLGGWLEAAAPPETKPEPKTFYKAGDLVRHPSYGTERLVAFNRAMNDGVEEWVTETSNEHYFDPLKDPILERDGRRPTWTPGTWVGGIPGHDFRLERFICFGASWEVWDYYRATSSTHEKGGWFSPAEYYVTPEPDAKKELFTGEHWEDGPKTLDAERLAGRYCDLDLADELRALDVRIAKLEAGR